MKQTLSFLALGVLLSVASPAATISLQSVTAAPGSSGAFDVSFTNDGSSAITVGAFTFGLSIPNTAINITDVTTAVNNYIFAGDSLFGPDLSGPLTGQTALASDVFDIPLSGTTVAPGATVGLGEVFFTVDSTSATGPFITGLVADPAVTSLSDPSGNAITIDALTDGAINVSVPTSGVPEPSTLLLLLAAAPVLYRRKRR